MKCFNHGNADAVGLCKNCQKGLCHDCLISSQDSLACKVTCEERVKLLNAFFNQNIYNRYNYTFLQRIIFGLFFILCGAAFYYPFSEVLQGLIYASLGIIFMIFALQTKR